MTRDGVAVHFVLGAAAAELLMREWYHQGPADAARLLLPLALWPLVLLAVRGGGRCMSERWKQVTRRIAFLAAAGVVLNLLIGSSLSTLTHGGDSALLIEASLLLLLLGGTAVWVVRWPEPRWATMRRTVAVTSVLLVLSQPVLAALRAPSLSWPPAGVREVSGPAKSTTVFLLLDELNAHSAQPFVDMLGKEGLQVRWKAVAPVGDGTMKVIPAMFTRRDFEQAKPCSAAAVCSGTNVLDFAQVAASRDDVDVVGFFHPYCAMKGLRYCAHHEAAASLWDADRWHCGWWRRVGFPNPSAPELCREYYGRAWNAMTSALIESLWMAPVWQQGGFLFAHVPLPHPPGASGTGSLESQYRDNVERAVALTHEIVARARKRDGSGFRIVIFSDHPLRQSVWCQSYWAYRSQGCEPVGALTDPNVPIIVAGDVVPDLTGVRTNGQIFDLISRR